MAVPNIDMAKLGQFLHNKFISGTIDIMSKNTKDWDLIQATKVGRPDGKTQTFMLLTGRGPARTQWANATSKFYPNSQILETQEVMFSFKELLQTIEIPFNVFRRTKESTAKYDDPLALEMKATATGLGRLLSAAVHGDGTGVIIQAGADADDAGIATGEVVITPSTADSARGFINWCERKDLLKASQPSGVLRNPTGGSAASFYAYQIKRVDRKNNKVYLQAINSDGVPIDLGASNIVTDDVFYRLQPSRPNLTAPIVDYSNCSDAIVGLETHCANDGRVCFGLTLDDYIGGQVHDAGDNVLDFDMFHSLLDELDIRNGQGEYSYSIALGAHAVLKKLIQLHGQDRRVITIDDQTRGFKRIKYQHTNHLVELQSSEFVPMKRIRLLPNKMKDNNVLELFLSDMAVAKMDGKEPDFIKKQGANGAERAYASYLEGYYALICRCNSALGTIRNFKLA